MASLSLDMFEVLPEELITTHIMPRLPMKSIGIARCVSKPWCSFLSTPEFVKSQLKLRPDSLIGFGRSFHIVSVTGETAKASYDAFCYENPINLPHIFLWGSCNGLVLLEEFEENRKLLTNPITLRAVYLAECHEHGDKTLAFSLGYDSLADDYKVVSFTSTGPYQSSGGHSLVHVYSVKMKSWRRIGLSPYDHCGWNCGEFLNDRLHWMVVDDRMNPHSASIASLNLTREEFEEVPLPSDVVFDRVDVLDRLVVLKVLQGRLTFISEQKPKRNEDLRIDVWVMKEYGKKGSWEKRININFPFEEWELKPTMYFHHCVCFLNEEEIVVQMSSLHTFAYNWRSGDWREITVLPGAPILSRSLTFKESLVSPY